MDRKKLKMRGRRTLVGHYWILVMIMALSSFLGVENASSFGNLKAVLSKENESAEVAISNSILDERFGGFTDIVRYISGGFGSDKVWESTEKIQEGLEESGNKIKDSLVGGSGSVKDTLEDTQQSISDGVTTIKEGLTDFKDRVEEEAKTVYENEDTEYIGPIEVGKKQGVFAMVANALTSGRFINKVFTGIATIVRSDSAAAIIIVILMILLSIFLWSFVARLMKVITRRFFLEARTYETVPIRRVFFLARAGRWMNTGWALFSTSFIVALWFPTIIGWGICIYRYLLVPFILAENPSIKGSEARKLSAQMMMGHKWEAFKLEFSFLGWKLLSSLTFGLLDLFFVNAYEASTMSEYYSELRLEAKKKKKSIPLVELLNDNYLYIKADDAVIDEAYADIKELEDEEYELPEKQRGVSGFLSRNFGLVLFANKAEEKLCEYEEHRQKVKTRQAVFDKKIYPFRLFPAYTKSILNMIKPPNIEYLHYVRRYSIWSLVIMFFIFSFVGWVWEIAIHLYEDGVFVNRGFLKGPYVPIYGCGSLIILLCLYRFRKKPLLEFVSAIVLCGILEYGTASMLDYMYHAKWWDYSGYFLNIQGRICAEGLLVFGIFGSLVVYFMAPILDNLLRKLRLRVVAPICIVLLLIFMADIIYSTSNPNTGAGITEYKTDALTQ